MSKRNIKYNTDSPTLKVPEYGRIVQNMVDYCVELEDREERQRCAEYIVLTMANQTKTRLDDPGAMKVLWDHLYVMSHYSLDIDFPFEPVSEEGYVLKPEKIPYSKDFPKYRHYGHGIEKMIDITKKTDDPELKEAREKITAIQMKKAYTTWNKGDVTDDKIFKDLYEMSDSDIYLDEFNCTLPKIQNTNAPTQGKNKQRRRKKKR